LRCIENASERLSRSAASARRALRVLHTCFADPDADAAAAAALLLLLPLTATFFTPVSTSVLVLDEDEDEELVAFVFVVEPDEPDEPDPELLPDDAPVKMSFCAPASTF
jgi:hypothetical protein